ncbi:unnamed protein product [Amoebophrya sp. A120]|nr:unnamed protein product [Amoebophrya sp. A120]|eukprot:GSA120T00015429001.1
MLVAVEDLHDYDRQVNIHWSSMHKNKKRSTSTALHSRDGDDPQLHLCTMLISISIYTHVRVIWDQSAGTHFYENKIEIQNHGACVFVPVDANFSTYFIEVEMQFHGTAATLSFSIYRQLLTDKIGIPNVINRNR